MKGLFKFLDYIGNLIIMNGLFVLTTVTTLGIGLGASLSALYATILELRCDNSGYYVRNYFKNFKRNFKISTISWIVLCGLFFASYLNILIINTINNEALKLVLYPLVTIFIIEFLFISFYIFLIIAKFDVDVLNAFTMAFAYAHRYIHYTILFMIIWVLAIYFPLYVSFASIFIVFALATKLQVKLINKVWRSILHEEISEF